MKKWFIFVLLLSLISLSSNVMAQGEFNITKYIVNSGGANYGTGYLGIFYPNHKAGESYPGDYLKLEQNIDWVKLKGPLKLDVIRLKYIPSESRADYIEMGETYKLDSDSNYVNITNKENETRWETTFIFGLPQNYWVENVPSGISDNFGVAYTPLESNSTPDILEQIEIDVKIIKNIGFKIVKLWDIDALYWIDYGDTLNKTLKIFDDNNVPVCIPLMPWTYDDGYGNADYSNFPYNFDLNNRFAFYVQVVASIAKYHPSVKWMALYMPGNSHTQKLPYKETLENFSSIWKFNFQNGEVRLFTDQDPYYYKFPTDFSNNITGFGIQPYSQISNETDAYATYIFYKYFSSTGKTIYIDEYGFRANRNNDIAWAGTAKDEDSKYYLLKKYRSYIATYSPSTLFVYFMLFDRNNFKQGDFGVVKLDRTWRKSAYAFYDTCNGQTYDSINVYAKGTILGYYAGESYSHTDNCSNRYNVIEYYCDDRIKKSTIIPCDSDYTCSSGRCQKTGTPGGCPILRAWNGSEKFVDVEKLNIHAPKDQDTTYTSSFSMQPIDGKYELILHEAAYWFWDGSHVNSVKLYDSNGKDCNLISATHSKEGNVLNDLLYSDDRRVRTYPEEEIKLVYDGCSGTDFTFTIEGYNMKCAACGMYVFGYPLILIAPFISFVFVLLTLALYLLILSLLEKHKII